MRINDRPYSYDSWADFYDLIDLDRTAMIGFYEHLIGADSRSLLELACGTGTMTAALADRLRRLEGCGRIVGLDNSTRMLEIAGMRSPEIEWILGDMRRPPLHGEFDLVICCYNTLHEMWTNEELLEVFRGVRKLLSPHGVFAFDIYQPNLQYLKAPRADCVVRSVVTQSGRQLQVLETTAYQPRIRVLNIDWRLVEKGKDAEPPLSRIIYGFRQYFPEEIDRLLAVAGLGVRKRYGDFDGSPFTSHSKKQIVLCGRA